MSNLKAKIRAYTGVAGFYTFKRLKAKDRSVVWESSKESPNLITDYGLELIGTEAVIAGGFYAHCSVGTGTTAPAFTDTALESRVATTSNTVASSSSLGNEPPLYYAQRSITFEFAEGAAAGNLSEVGVGVQSDGTQLQSRARIVDGMGDPTTITVLADEILQVTFILRLYPNTADVTGQITLAGNNYDYTIRPYQLSSTLFWEANLNRSTSKATVSAGRNTAWETDTLVAIEGAALSGSNSNRSTTTTAAYSVGTLERSFTNVFGLDRANFPTGIGIITFTTDLSSGWQIGFSPKIPKIDTQILELTFTHTWGRYTP